MSEWYKADKGDIAEINPDTEEVDIHVTYNEMGNVYLTLTFDQIEEIHTEIAAYRAERVKG